jgi:hypothetical protein
MGLDRGSGRLDREGVEGAEPAGWEVELGQRVVQLGRPMAKGGKGDWLILFSLTTKSISRHEECKLRHQPDLLSCEGGLL